jgi:acyl-CoA thioester hydrolase
MRLELPDQKTFVHECVVPMRWGDMDAYGHINNTLYFRFMEIARIDWMRSVGHMDDGSGTGPVIVNAFCNFLVQLTFPGDLRVKHYVTQPGRSSFDTYVTIERTDRPGEVAATGGATVVWVDLAAGSSVPLPQALVSRLRTTPQ